MKKIISTMVFTFFAVTWIFFTGLPEVRAQNSSDITAPSADTGPNTINETVTGTVRGEVLKSENGTITIKTDSGTKTVSLPQTIEVKRNWRLATPTDIRPGDRVTLTMTSGGTVLSADVKSGSAGIIKTFSVPLIAGSLLLAGAFWALTRKSKSQQINTYAV